GVVPRLVDVGTGTVEERHPLEEPAGSFGARVSVDDFPERLVVADLDEVGEFVHEHVVEHPGGHVLQPVGDPDGAVQRRARTPPGRLVRYPPDRTRADPLGQVFTGEALGPFHEVGGGELAARLAALHPLNHPIDPLILLPASEVPRNRDDEPARFSERRHGAAPPSTPAHFDRALPGHVSHHALTSPHVPTLSESRTPRRGNGSPRGKPYLSTGPLAERGFRGDWRTGRTSAVPKGGSIQ